MLIILSRLNNDFREVYSLQYIACNSYYFWQYKISSIAFALTTAANERLKHISYTYIYNIDIHDTHRI